MKHRLLKNVVIALAVGAVAVPLAHATNPYDGYKSSYPQLHQLTTLAAPADVDLKSGYPQLHVVLSHQVAARLVTKVDLGFDWRDAAIGAGTAAGAIFLIAACGLVFSRRQSRLAL